MIRQLTRPHPVLLWFSAMGSIFFLTFNRPWCVIPLLLTLAWGFAMLAGRWMTPPTKPTPDLSRADMIRLSADVDMPWIDYDNGEIWTAERCREWVAGETRRAAIEAHISELEARVSDYRHGGMSAMRWHYDALDAARKNLRDLEDER